jgi:hypothetical protein
MSIAILPGLTREQFPKLLTEYGYRFGAEIGVEQGDHAVQLLRSWSGCLLLIDCWQVQDKQTYCDQAAYWTQADQEANYRKTLVAIRAFSVEAAKEVPDSSLDFVYLDANHSYSAVCADLRAWYPKVREGGLISGHDFVDSGDPFGVKSAVLEFIRELPVDLYVAPKEEWKTWFWLKGEMKG